MKLLSMRAQYTQGIPMRVHFLHGLTHYAQTEHGAVHSRQRHEQTNAEVEEAGTG